MNTTFNSNIRVLLAEPDEKQRLAICRAMERQGLTVVDVADGAEALARFSDEPFNVVIASVLMPRRDGLEVLREIRTASPETQIILLTEQRSIGSAAFGLREGAYAYILKPVDDFGQLSHYVATAVELQRLRRAEIDAPTPALVPVASIEPRVVEPHGPATVDVLRQLCEQTRTGQPLPDTLQLLLQAGANVFGAKQAVLVLSRPDGGYQLKAWLGLDQFPGAATAFVQKIGDAFIWRVSSERKTLVGSTPDGSHFAGIPVVALNRLLGIVCISLAQEADLNPSRQELVESLAAEGAVAIEMDHLVDENDRLSPIDSSTGTLKRSAFLEIAEREFRRSWRFDQPLTAMFVDIDGMSELNAKYGTAFGDNVLRQVGSIFRGTIRAFDLITRYEADAFALLFIMSNRAGARGAGQRLRMAVNSLNFSANQEVVHISASIGTCSYPHEGCASVYDLLDLAHQNQLAARRGGPNQVLFA